MLGEVFLVCAKVGVVRGFLVLYARFDSGEAFELRFLSANKGSGLLGL